MSNTKISALTSATTPLAGTEVLPIVQSSTTKKVAVSDLTAGRDISAKKITATDNFVVSTAGKGIHFSANSHAAGMTKELLDWYEEGTWTPVFSGLTTTGSPTYAGEYTRVGRQVFFKITITPNGGSTQSTANTTYATTLPFTCSGSSVCIATNNAVGNYGTGLVFDIYVNPPTWAQTTRPIYITGVYTV